MSRKSIICIIILFLQLLINNIISAKTAVTIDTGAVAAISDEDIGIADILLQVEKISNKNGPYVANGFALANILGYPVGKSYLGHFPHFQAGISAGAGCTNMKYYDDDDPASSDGSLPVIAPNPVLHFGIGLFGGFDVLGKFFYISKSSISDYKDDMDYEYDFATLTDFKIYSVGGKLRYNLIKKQTLLPLYLSFGGITVSLGGDFIYGNIAVKGDYEKTFNSIPVNIGGMTEQIDINFEGEFQARINWAVFSVNLQAIAYLDIFYLLSMYTGFGLSGNVGSFSVDFSGDGTLTSANQVYTAYAGTPLVGTLAFQSKNTYRASPVIPTYIIGFEINILVLKLNAETMVNMNNRSDVNVQIGTRIEF